jgi:hypothetical protein
MRFYSIVITNPANGKLIKPKSLSGLNSSATYSSVANGVNLPGALNIEIDIPVSVYATPSGDGSDQSAAYVKIHGISLEEISQASDLNYMDIAIYGGMSKGLPLANPKQQGLLVQGQILQAYGNWIGTDMTLDLVIVSKTGSITNPANIAFTWKKGSPLSDAIKTAMATAFPSYKANIAIDANLTLPADEHGIYSTIGQFAQYIKQVSFGILGKNPDYAGVDILLNQGTLIVSDGTTTTTPKQIAFNDLIGQPTWIEPQTLQFKCPIRADINPLDYIVMPKSNIQVATGPGSQSQYRDKSSFQGTFRVNFMRHVGNFRQPDADSWVTTFNAFVAKGFKSVSPPA